MISVSALAPAGVAAACVMVAGCSAAPAPAPAPGSGRPSAPASAAACFLLSGAQMRAAVGTPVGRPDALPPGVCVHQLPHAAGTLNFDVTSFSSAAQARGSLRDEESSDSGVTGMKILPVPGLGQEAVAVTSSEGAFALVVAGTKELTVSISWPRATAQMVITLAREAARRLG
jgi:hypothetical protein